MRHSEFPSLRATLAMTKKNHNGPVGEHGYKLHAVWRGTLAIIQIGLHGTQIKTQALLTRNQALTFNLAQ